MDASSADKGRTVIRQVCLFLDCGAQENGVSSLQMLPTPQHFCRKHDFANGHYETLSVFYVPERMFEGVPHPRILKCQMFGSLAPQEEFDAPDIETGQSFLDAHFRRRFPEHQCNEGCIEWPKFNEPDDLPEDSLNHPIQ